VQVAEFALDRQRLSLLRFRMFIRRAMGEETDSTNEMVRASDTRQNSRECARIRL
jgi:hypothetical protein